MAYPRGMLGRLTLSDRELASWTERIGFAGSYMAASGDARVTVDIEEDDDPGRYRSATETFRTKYVAAELVSVHAVGDAKLLNYLADLLGVPQAQRTGITVPAIDGVLWRLGKMRVADTQLDAWVVRGLSSSADNVFEHFRTASLPAGSDFHHWPGSAKPGFAAPRLPNHPNRECTGRTCHQAAL